jgi:hypothetical protein
MWSGPPFEGDCGDRTKADLWILQKGDKKMRMQNVSKRIGHVIGMMLVGTLFVISAMVSLGLIIMVGKGLWWVIQK